MSVSAVATSPATPDRAVGDDQDDKDDDDDASLSIDMDGLRRDLQVVSGGNQGAPSSSEGHGQGLRSPSPIEVNVQRLPVKILSSSSSEKQQQQQPQSGGTRSLATLWTSMENVEIADPPSTRKSALKGSGSGSGAGSPVPPRTMSLSPGRRSASFPDHPPLDDEGGDGPASARSSRTRARTPDKWAALTGARGSASTNVSSSKDRDANANAVWMAMSASMEEELRTMRRKVVLLEAEAKVSERG